VALDGFTDKAEQQSIIERVTEKLSAQVVGLPSKLTASKAN